MAYTAVSFAYKEVLTSAKMTLLAENDAYLKGRTDAYDAAYVAWTPTFANFTLGDGTASGKYKRVGRMIHHMLRVTLGATSSFTGLLIYTLPVSIQGADGSMVYSFGGCGDASAGGSGPGLYSRAWSATQLAVYTASTGAGVSSGTPFTWTSGDTFTLSGTYEGVA